VARYARSALTDVVLRDVERGDLPFFFEHQLDPEATSMAGFPARDEKSFMAHWDKILKDESVVKKTIVFQCEVAGNVVSFVRSGGREVGYWIGKKHWGKGIATHALATFLSGEERRPLFAYVAISNAASIRVLEKCGFRITGEEPEGLILELAANGTTREGATT
jgi:RimJ/RimL family protein N-acetyltransferase